MDQELLHPPREMVHKGDQIGTGWGTKWAKETKGLGGLGII